MDSLETNAVHFFLEQETYCAIKNYSDLTPFIIYTQNGCDAVGRWSFQPQSADSLAAATQCLPCAGSSFGHQERSKQMEEKIHVSSAEYIRTQRNTGRTSRAYPCIQELVRLQYVLFTVFFQCRDN